MATHFSLLICFLRTVFGLMLLHFCGATPGLGQHPDHLFKPREMQQDLIWLQEKMLRYHPACLDAERYDSVKMAFEMAQYEAEKPLNELQFLRLLRKTLQSLRCGHTTAAPSKAFYSYYQKAIPKPVFPLQVFRNREGTFVRFNGSNDTSIAVGDKIVSINQEPMEVLANEILEILPGDGYHQTFKNHHLSLNFPTYHLFIRGPSYAYASGLVDSAGKFSTHVFSLRSTGKARTRLEPSKSTTVLLRDNYRQLSTLKSNPQVACLKVFAFGGKSSFYQKAFHLLRQNGIQKLVLDIRGNAGGNLFNANELLRYLLADTFSMTFRRKRDRIRLDNRSNMSLAMRFTLEAFRWFPSESKRGGPVCRTRGNLLENRFFFEPEKDKGYTGKLVVLMDGGTFSAASLVAAKLRKLAKVRLVGEESGGAARGCYAMITPTLKLRNTRLRVTLPLYEIDHEAGPVPFRGLIPDYTLAPDITRMVRGLDEELEFLARNFDGL